MRTRPRLEPRTKYDLVHLPATASLRALVRLTHQRWAIEQQYQELKDELGLDHFEGRSLPGWQTPRRPHRARVHLAAVRTPTPGARLPTLPVVRAVITES